MMRLKGDPQVGRFSVEFEVANNDDVADARRGRIKPEQVRRVNLSGVVDPGAARLVLPASVVKKLGLEPSEKVRVRYADGRSSSRDRVKNVYVEIQGRDGSFSAVVEPKRSTALIGAIVLEELDFIVDCTLQKLVPRDPRHIVSEIE